MMKQVLIGAALLVCACGSRNASSAEVNKTMQTLGQSTEQPVMAVEPEESPSGTFQAEGTVEFDKTVHDFGDVSVKDGPLSCTFTVKNIGKDPVAIYTVVTSCGCTEAEWTREPLQPGQTGTISATYKNEDGPMPFDKTLTVYIAGVNKPVILRMRGVVHEKKKTVAELYGNVRLGGALGLKTLDYKVPNVLQGESAGDAATVANLGKQPLTLTFTDVSPHLKVEAVPARIPAGETATLRYTVTSSRDCWGKHTYRATPVLNGKKAEKPLTFTALTRENFASWDAERRKNASQCLFDESTVSFGSVTAGTQVEVSYPFVNKGKSALVFYSADTDTEGVTITLPGETGAQKKGSIPVKVDTSSLPKGETVIMLTLTTNSPARPLINLFLVGQVK